MSDPAASRRERLGALTGEEVRAAGGVVVRNAARAPEVAVVHRPKHADWSLPKGKLAAGESWEEAAIREVEEETGLRCELVEELEPARYRDRHGRPKLVRWWLMRPLDGEFAPTDEVDELRWLEPAAAVARLDYEHDRDLVRSLDSKAFGRISLSDERPAD